MRKTGFTLIELVMVIVIIGILAAVAIPKFMDLQTEAKVARCQSDIGAIRTGISGWYAKYYANNSTCPSGTPGDCNSTSGFPTAANINGTSLGFAKFAFSNGAMPDSSHIVNNPNAGWAAAYNETSGDINQTTLCGR